MGNHIFKDLSASKTIQTMAFDPPGVKFLHGSSTGYLQENISNEMWYQVTNKKTKNQTMTKTKTGETSNFVTVGEPTESTSAQEKYLTNLTTHPGLYQFKFNNKKTTKITKTSKTSKPTKKPRKTK